MFRQDTVIAIPEHWKTDIIMPVRGTRTLHKRVNTSITRLDLLQSDGLVVHAFDERRLHLDSGDDPLTVAEHSVPEGSQRGRCVQKAFTYQPSRIVMIVRLGFQTLSKSCIRHRVGVNKTKGENARGETCELEFGFHFIMG